MDRLTAQAIESQCARLLLRSVRFFDARDWKAFAELFTPEGVFIRANEPEAPLTGRSAIIAALAARPQSRLTRHLCTNIEIDAHDETRAQGRCYLLLYAAEASQPPGTAGHRADETQRVGEYHDVYVCTGDGWRIARRAGKLILHTGP